MTKQSYIPSVYHSVTPYLTVQGVEQLIDFLKQVFDAQERERITRPDGTIGHAEVRIDGSVVMLSEASDDWKPMPSALYVYVPDTDATYQRALQAGATSLMEPADQFYGDRTYRCRDLEGHFWTVGAPIRTVSVEEAEAESGLKVVKGWA
jgi:PhnB protein